MPPEQLLGVAEEHAAERVPIAVPAHAAGEVREALTSTIRCADDVAVVDDGALVGLVQIEALLAAASRIGSPPGLASRRTTDDPGRLVCEARANG